MKSHRIFNSFKTIFLTLFIIVLSLFFTNRVTTQNKGCGCDKLGSCEEKEKEKKPPTEVEPIKPFEHGEGKKKMTIFPVAIEKELPGINEGSGVAEDTEDNYLIGKKSLSGHFAQRRRYLLNTLTLSRSFQQDGQISQANYTKLVEILNEALKHVNEEERIVNQAENQAILDERKKAFKEGGKVDVENARKTNETLKMVKNMDLNTLNQNLKSIYQTISDNLGQSRGIQLMGAVDDTESMDRAKKIVEELFKKVMNECQGKKIKPSDIGGIARTALFLSVYSEEEITQMMNKCFSRTLVARFDAGGISYEARHCANSYTNSESTQGNWKITVGGAMQGTGKAQIGPGRIGDYEIVSNISGAGKITQQGVAQVITANGQCVFRLKAPTAAAAEVGGQVVTMPGMTSGDLPIQVVDEVCKE